MDKHHHEEHDHSEEPVLEERLSSEMKTHESHMKAQEQCECSTFDCVSYEDVNEDATELHEDSRAM